MTYHHSRGWVSHSTKENKMPLRKIYPICFLFFLLIFCSCTPADHSSQPAPTIDAEKAFLLLKQGAAIRPRHSGSPGATATVDFIAENIKKLSLSVELDKWHKNTPVGKIGFCNVIADIPGKKEEFILVGCHYDGKKLASLPNFEGANDGASGVALQLEIMAAIKKYKTPPPATIRFVFFDGEECIIEYSDTDGLYGSRHLAEKMKRNGDLQKCLAVVILDMVGDIDLGITIPAGTDKILGQQLEKIAAAQKHADKFSWHERDITDDHTPFQRLGIPAIDIIDFEFGPNNRYWHTEADTVAKTSRESLEIVGNAVLQLLWDIPLILP